jgi:hypothetical protein
VLRAGLVPSPQSARALGLVPAPCRRGLGAGRVWGASYVGQYPSHIHPSGTKLAPAPMLPEVPSLFVGDRRGFPYFAYDPVSSAGVSRVRPGYFHIFRPGELGTIVHTAVSIVVNQELANLFTKVVPSGWSRQEAVIRDPASWTEIRDRYVEIVVDTEVTPQALPQDVSGMKVWRYGQGALFVSPELMDAIKAGFPEVSFSIGFSGFAGAG